MAARSPEGIFTFLELNLPSTPPNSPWQWKESGGWQWKERKKKKNEPNKRFS